MKIIAMLIAYPFLVAIGTILGCMLYCKFSNLKRKMKIKRKILKNKSEGKETCPYCYSGVSFETKSIGIRESLNKDNSDIYKAIVRCHYCGCDHGVIVHNDEFNFI